MSGHSASIFFPLEGTPAPRPTPALVTVPTPAAPVAEPVPAAAAPAPPAPAVVPVRRKIHLTDEDRLILVRLCVQHQEKYRRRNKENFWKEIKKHFSDATGKNLSDPRDAMSTMLTQLEVDDKKEETGSGTVQNYSDLKQALRLWKDHRDAIAKDSAGKKKTKEDLEAGYQTPEGHHQNLRVTRSQKRKGSSSESVNLDSTESESEEEKPTLPKRARINPEIQLLVKTLDNMRQETRTMAQDFSQTIRESLRVIASLTAPSTLGTIPVAPQTPPVPSIPVPPTPVIMPPPPTIDARLATVESTMTEILAALNELKQRSTTTSSSTMVENLSAVENVVGIKNVSEVKNVGAVKNVSAVENFAAVGNSSVKNIAVVKNVSAVENAAVVDNVWVVEQISAAKNVSMAPSAPKTEYEC